MTWMNVSHCRVKMTPYALSRLRTTVLDWTCICAAVLLDGTVRTVPTMMLREGSFVLSSPFSLGPSSRRLLAGPAGEALSEVELGAEALSGALATGRRGRGRGMWSPGARRGVESRCAAAAGDDRGWNTLGSLMRDE